MPLATTHMDGRAADVKSLRFCFDAVPMPRDCPSAATGLLWVYQMAAGHRARPRTQLSRTTMWPHLTLPSTAARPRNGASARRTAWSRRPVEKSRASCRRPERLVGVEAAIVALAGCEIYGRDPKGKLVVVVDAPDAGSLGTTLNTIALLPDVYSASLVFHAIDAG